MKFVHVTTLHLGVPLMGRQQIEAPWPFHMALAYFCDISRLLCNKVCVQVNLLCATYCLLPSMVFHSTINCSKYSGTSHYGHLTSKKTSQLQSPWLSPKLYSTVQITPCNKVTSPLRSLLPSPVGDLNSEVVCFFMNICPFSMSS